MPIRRLTATVAVSLSLVVAACGSDDESTADGPDPVTASAVVPVVASTDEVDLGALEGDVMLWMWAPW